MTVDFNTRVDRIGTESIKWDYRGTYFGNPNALPLWVADMDFPSPPQVAEAICKRAEHPMFGYTGVSNAYLEAVIEWMRNVKKWEIEADWIVHSPGVVTSLDNAVLAFTQPGDKVLIQTPVYGPFYACVRNNGRTLVSNPLQYRDGRFTMDLEDLEKKLADGVGMMILCSPHNPVGRVWTREELAQVCRLCSRYGVLLVADEIHSDLVYPQFTHTSLGLLAGEFACKAITLISPTKTFNLAGLLVSLAVIPDRDMRTRFAAQLNRCGADGRNIFGTVAAEAAYRHGKPWLEELMAYLQENLNLLRAFFEQKIPEIKVVVPEGTYMVWLDCRELEKKVGNLRDFFIHKAEVVLGNGTDFGEEGAGFQRLNYACPRELLEEALGRIEKAVREHNR